METSSISLNNQTELTSTTSTPTSKNAYYRFFCNPLLLAANLFYILPDQRPKTTTSSTKYASVPTVSNDNPVENWDPSGECVHLVLFCLGFGGGNSNATWVTVHPGFVWEGGVPNDNLVVYGPFYRDVIQGISQPTAFAKAMADLWYGLYQHGGAGTPVSSSGLERLSRLQLLDEEFADLPLAPCTNGYKVEQFACSVSLFLSQNLSNATGAPTLQAYSHLLNSVKERSLAFMVYNYSANQDWTELASVALQVYKAWFNHEVPSPGLGNLFKINKIRKITKFIGFSFCDTSRGID